MTAIINVDIHVVIHSLLQQLSAGHLHYARLFSLVSALR